MTISTTVIEEDSSSIDSSKRNVVQVQFDAAVWTTSSPSALVNYPSIVNPNRKSIIDTEPLKAANSECCFYSPARTKRRRTQRQDVPDSRTELDVPSSVELNKQGLTEDNMVRINSQEISPKDDLSQGSESTVNMVSSINDASNSPVVSSMDSFCPNSTIDDDMLITDNTSSDTLSEGDDKVCLICMESFTEDSPGINIPCKNKCKETLVHEKCIYEWQVFHPKNPTSSEYGRQMNQNADSNTIDKALSKKKTTCPLCRSELSKTVLYKPADYIGSANFGDMFARKQFLLEPVPPEEGFVRCFVKVNYGNMTSTVHNMFVYELYLQAPTSLSYPLGPVPDATSPHEDDQLLAFANKAKYINNSSPLASLVRLDIFLNKYKTESEQYSLADNYVGTVRSMHGGFKHEILIPQSYEQVDETLTDNSCREYNVSKDVRKLQSNTNVIDVGCVHFVHNRLRSSVGPRKMELCLPPVKSIPVHNPKKQRIINNRIMTDKKWVSCPNIRFEEISKQQQQNLSNTKFKTLSNVLVERNMSVLSVEEEVEYLFGQNKTPYWLESIKAYSLDFKGRVVLPSNKNFQLLLQQNKKYSDNKPQCLDNNIPIINQILDSEDDIVLQFGKVAETRVSGDGYLIKENEKVIQEIYTMDFKWPLTPLQAFGICLSACDRNMPYKSS